MSFDNFYIVLVFSGIILGILSASILLFSNKAHKHANRLLAFTILITVLNISTNALLKTDFYVNYPHFFRVTSPLLYMYSALIYLYIRAIVKDETGFKKWDWVFFIPAILHFCELLPFYILSTEAKRYFITTVIRDPIKLNHFAPYTFSPYTHNIIKAVLGLVYMFFALRLLKINKNAIAKRSPDQNTNIYRWLLTLATTVLVLYILTLFFIFLPFEDGVDINRNYPFYWNSGVRTASSDTPGSVFYRGPGPASARSYRSDAAACAPGFPCSRLRAVDYP